MNDGVAITDLGAFRVCPHGYGIAYRAMMETTGPRAVDLMVTAGQRAGAAHRASERHPEPYALLDGYDARGDIITDWCIADAEAWQWWCRAAELRVESSDCPTCEPAAYAGGSDR